MVLDTEIKDIISQLEKGSLGLAIAKMENLGYAYPEMNVSEQLRPIKENFRLMGEYWSKGYQDPNIDRQYQQMLRQMYRLAANIGISRYMKSNPMIGNIRRRVCQQAANWSADAVRERLENFVTDVTMLELDTAADRSAKSRELYLNHHNFVSELFGYLLTMGQMTDGEREAFREMLLTPTVAGNDQQVMVSAIMLNAMNVFDPNKCMLLIEVYDKAADEHVKQRALAGWMLVIDGCCERLFPEVKELLDGLFGSPDKIMEMAEMQMQMLLCMNAETDNATIQREIMPELLKHNKLYRNMDDADGDSLDEILNPGESDRNLEKVEESIKKMMDMHKQGKDIYFGGFSQMKRYPFFDSICNWFVPFYLDHPGIVHVKSTDDGGNMLGKMMAAGPLCDSDKYSFALALSQVLDSLPKEMKNMLKDKEMAGMGLMAAAGLGGPVYIRRTYLQNLYRFYRLFPSRQLFRNPFQSTDKGTAEGCLVMGSLLMRDKRMDSALLEVAAFLTRHKMYAEAARVLENYEGEEPDFRYYVMCGNVLMHADAELLGVRLKETKATECFRKALQLEYDPKVLKTYAKALYYNNEQEKACEIYKELIDVYSGNTSVMLNYSVCLTNLGEYDEALKLLYRLSYENPGNISVSRVLARALTGAGKFEQAENAYGKIQASNASDGDDMRDMALCMWLAGKTQAAIGLFVKYAKAVCPHYDALALRQFVCSDIIDREKRLLETHGKGRVETELMVDAICGIL